MQRSKQTALMFLLGATLVGGALGFSAAGYLNHEKVVSQFAPRPKFYDELGLSQEQRATVDSLMFQQDCAIRSVIAPMRPRLDSIRTTFRSQVEQVFTKAQLTLLDSRRKEHDARRLAEQAKEPKRTCSAN
jgi:hypothetical protein